MVRLSKEENCILYCLIDQLMIIYTCSLLVQWYIESVHESGECKKTYNTCMYHMVH